MTFIPVLHANSQFSIALIRPSRSPGIIGPARTAHHLCITHPAYAIKRSSAAFLIRGKQHRGIGHRPEAAFQKYNPDDRLHERALKML